MRVTTFVLTGFACLALVGAAAAAPPAPGQALYPETVPGAGLTGVAGAQATVRHVVRGSGSVGSALFTIDVGRGNSVVYFDAARHLRFHALHIGFVRFADNTATLGGIGLLNRHRVAFTVYAIHNAQPGIDVFRIAWLHGVSMGGRVADGSVFIR